MSGNEIVSVVLKALDALSIPSMIVGSFSSNAYGIERSTKDADLVIHSPRPFTGDLQAALGSGFRVDSQLEFEGVTGTSRNVIHVLNSDFKVELFHLSDDEHDQERFRRRRSAPFMGRTAFVATPEDVVVMKLRWAKKISRPKDLDDVRNVLGLQGDKLDFAYIHAWCDRHGTRALLEEIIASIPEID